MNKNQTVRVGIVGAGHICPFHIEALQRLDDVEIIGISDFLIKRAETIAKQYHLPKVYAQLNELLAESDVVHVLTPPETHANLTVQALKKGCHVFVEKPMATCVSDCNAIIRAAETHGGIVGVDHSLLLDPFTLQARRIVASGRIGVVHSVECIRSQDYPLYEGGPLPEMYAVGGYPFRDLGIHALYQIEAFLGPIIDVKWMMGHQGDDPTLCFDEWQAMARCRQGSAHLRISWNSRPLQDLILIHGAKGTIKVDRFGLSVTTKREGRLPEHPQRAFNAIAEAANTCCQVPWNLAKIVTKKIRRYHGLQSMVSDFYSRLRDGKPPLVGPEDARRIGYWSEMIAADADQQKELLQAKYARPLIAKTLVTGATGLIGSHLLDRLLEAGQPIRILTRRPPPQHLRNHPLVEVVLGDLGDPIAVDRAVEGTEIVFHSGGVLHGAAVDFVRGNVVGTENVVTSCLKHQVQQLVYMSSLSVLQAIREDETPIDENCPLEKAPEKRGHYTQTKLNAEVIVTRAVRQFGLPAVILRPGEVIGEGAALISYGVGIRKGSRLIMFGDGRLEVPLVDVEDLVDALLLSKDKGITDGTILHLVDSDSKSQNEMAKQYCELTGDALQPIHVPRFMLYSLGFCVQTLFGLFGRSPSLSIYRLQSALATRKYNVSAATDGLGWSPRRGIDQGLTATLEAAQATASSVSNQETLTDGNCVYKEMGDDLILGETSRVDQPQMPKCN